MGLKDLAGKLDAGKLQDVANEVQKAVDVDKVVKSATKDGKLDIKGAVETVSKEVSADEAKSIANAAKKALS